MAVTRVAKDVRRGDHDSPIVIMEVSHIESGILDRRMRMLLWMQITHLHLVCQPSAAPAARGDSVAPAAEEEAVDHDP